MSEQKSLSRRNRSRYYMNSKDLYANSYYTNSTLTRRWLAQGRSASQRQMVSHLSVAETGFTERPPNTANEQTTTTPDRPELSEAECDIDTLKKLKLGLRSSLWSRPSGSNHPSDYSIAV